MRSPSKENPHDRQSFAEQDAAQPVQGRGRRRTRFRLPGLARAGSAGRQTRREWLRPYGPVAPVRGHATGLELLQLPETGDYRGREFAGASFDPSGDVMFANMQSPGITYAIWGPWARGNP